MDDIFKFWNIAGSGILDESNAGPFVHPLDRDVLARAPHGFSLKCLPISFVGPLRKARVVLLFLSPGFRDFDLRHARSREGREYYVRQWSGKGTLPNPEDHPTANRWLSRVIGQFGFAVDDVADRLAVLNIGAYHSATFGDRHMLAALPSSRVTLGWAQNVLFPEAVDGKRVVVCLRSAKFWGLTLGKCYGKALFVPKCTPNGMMHHGPCRKRTIGAVRAALEGE